MVSFFGYQWGIVHKKAEMNKDYDMLKVLNKMKNLFDRIQKKCIRTIKRGDHKKNIESNGRDVDNVQRIINIRTRQIF